MCVCVQHLTAALASGNRKYDITRLTFWNVGMPVHRAAANQRQKVERVETKWCQTFSFRSKFRPSRALCDHMSLFLSTLLLNYFKTRQNREKIQIQVRDFLTFTAFRAPGFKLSTFVTTQLHGRLHFLLLVR